MSPRQLTPEREAAAEAALRSGVVKRGGLCLKIAPTQRGAPDRLVLMPEGRTFLIELKSPTGRLSPAQTLWHARAADRGHTVVVLTGRRGVSEWFASLDAEVLI